MCASTVFPVEDCIVMEPLRGGIDPRTGQPIVEDYANSPKHPINPNRAAAE